MDGKQSHDAEGRWGRASDRLYFDWGGGSFERAQVDWIEDNSVAYRIVEQNDKRQIGMATTFNRQ